ncbi:hypothetical protein NG99_26245 [Erwinia typographi]|uniref:Uncharacterized protein n=1 Tax=Erwinia typographi TaxID=371042 RepID=A0A0A3YHZ4_9GAMM|nr:hypothetical protein [Erwinia typographi]KGT86265.1 hypothetical protein NG99_26245 [Erwinia typographi]
MKMIRLEDTMKHLQLTVRDDGYEMHSPAGSACYDAWGVRTTVNGIPEYFPVTLNLRDERDKPEKDKEELKVEPWQPLIRDGVISDGAITTSTLQVKLELDTSDFDEQASEFLEKKVLGIIKKELKPGGLLWWQ